MFYVIDAVQQGANLGIACLLFALTLTLDRSWVEGSSDGQDEPSRIVPPPETGEQPSLSSGLSDAPLLNRRRPGSLYSIITYEPSLAGQWLPAAGGDGAWAARTGSGPMLTRGAIFAVSRGGGAGC